jgi:tRNA(Ile)-lysidine synthase
MHKFVRSLITEWRKLELPFSGETIVVAVSGGADSMSLLLAIHDLVRRKKLSLRIVVGHFNHKLRSEESDADEEFVREQAERAGFEFFSQGGRVSRSGNLEQNARNARYTFLTKLAVELRASAVLTAHTRNDQAETFLINLVRGSGVDGLAAMPSMRKLDGGILLARPLLSWAFRNDTEAYCRELGVEFRHDRMNDDDRYTRTRIRKTILPSLAELNPRIVDTIARTSELVRLEVESGPTTEQSSRNKNGDLSIRDLNRLEKPSLYPKLRRWLRTERGNLRGISLSHIQSIERLIGSRKSGKTAELPGGGRVVKQDGRLVFKHIKVEK